MRVFLFGLLFSAALGLSAASFHDFTMTDIDGKPVDFKSYAGKAVLVVNTASYCGFTPQFAALEKLYERYRDQGLVVLGFPSNDFMGQDPGNDAEIKNFCTANYAVSFPMFAKSVVKGKGQSPLYAWLVSKEANPKTAGAITWNFNKFLIGKDGKLLARWDSAVSPDQAGLVKAVEAALK